MPMYQHPSLEFRVGHVEKCLTTCAQFWIQAFANITLIDAFLPSFLFWRWAGCPRCGLMGHSCSELAMPFVDALRGCPLTGSEKY